MVEPRSRVGVAGAEGWARSNWEREDCDMEDCEDVAESGSRIRAGVDDVGESTSTDTPVVFGDSALAMIGAGMVWRLR
jgi:hypothetical protein